MAPDRFVSRPQVAQAYRVAGQIPAVLAQQPCYCYCDSLGHSGLLDCFVTEHGAACDVCVKEAILADQMTKEGAAPADIRQAIIGGAWQSIESK